MSFDKSAFTQDLKRKAFVNPFKKESVKEHITAVNQIDPGNVFRTGKTQAKKTQARQSLLIEKQRQREELSLAESDDEIARRRNLAKSGKAGRKSLIQTSETGAATLGGS